MQISYILLFFFYALFSYVFVDPNLILIKADWFMNWQHFLWNNFLAQTDWRTSIFLILILALIINYLLLLKKSFKFKRKYLWLAIPIILLLTYNALSHDVFNYIFNARMVLKYQANPHQSVTLDFTSDTWTRFMNNTHTVAPYGYAWTGLSLLPYALGFGKFLITWLNFKGFALLGLVLTAYFSWKLAQKEKIKVEKFLLLWLNPLILIETIGNGHNDWWMMWPVIASFYLLKIKKKKALLLIILLMTLSISTKYASLVVLPFLIYRFFEKEISQLKLFSKKIFKDAKNIFDLYFWDLLSIGLFLPLCTARSQRFLTWYLIWPMIFLPFLRSKWWRNNLIVFSLAALLSYLPWVVYLPWTTFGQETPNILLLKQIILWLPATVYNLLFLVKQLLKRLKTK